MVCDVPGLTKIVLLKLLLALDAVQYPPKPACGLRYIGVLLTQVIVRVTVPCGDGVFAMLQVQKHKHARNSSAILFISNSPISFILVWKI